MPHSKWYSQNERKLYQTEIKSEEGKEDGVVMMGPKRAVFSIKDIAVGKWARWTQGREQSNGGQGKGTKIGGQ